LSARHGALNPRGRYHFLKGGCPTSLIAVDYLSPFEFSFNFPWSARVGKWFSY
jgi:hypothetical protein